MHKWYWKNTVGVMDWHLIQGEKQKYSKLLHATDVGITSSLADNCGFCTILSSPLREAIMIMLLVCE